MMNVLKGPATVLTTDYLGREGNTESRQQESYREMLSTFSLFLKHLGTPGLLFQKGFCSQRFTGLLFLKTRTHSQGSGRETGICLEIVVFPSGPQGWLLA